MENNEGAVIEPIIGEGEGAENLIKLSKQEYDDLLKAKSDFGSLKREFKDLKKSLEETPPKTNTDNGLLEKAFLRSAGLTKQTEVDLALSTAKKWNQPIDELVNDPDFLVKLQGLRDQEANVNATSNIRGGSGDSQAKYTAEYWQAKGTYPTAQDVPDRKVRAKIARAFMSSAKEGKKYYSE